MGWLLPDYNTPGPGVGPDTPRKKGFARLAEVIGRDFLDFYKAGFLALAGAMPFVAGVIFAVHTNSLLPLVLSGLFGGMIAAPEIVGLFDTILRALRDEPGWWWGTYRRAWKQNAVASLLPGTLFGLLLAVQIFALCLLSDDIGRILLLTLGVLFTLGLAVYVFAQLTLMNLPFGGMLKNAVFLLIGNLVDSGVFLLGFAVYAIVIWYLYPVSAVLLLLGGVWFPALTGLLKIYPILDETFEIESRIKTLQDSQKNHESL